MRLPKAITEVEIANPYNEKSFIEDKRAIVDIKAFDRDGECYQVEVQTSIPSYLHQRILYMWADLYADQLNEGDEKEKAQAEKEKAQAEKEKERAEKEKALRELERLRAMLDAQAVKKPRVTRAKKKLK